MKDSASGSDENPRRRVTLWLPLLAGAGTLTAAVAVLPGISLLMALALAAGAAGAACVAYASMRIAALATGWARKRPLKPDLLRLGCWSGSSVVYLVLVTRILKDDESGLDLALWALGLGLVIIPLSRLRRPVQRMPSSKTRIDIAVIGVLMALTAVLHAHDLRDWYYTAIGDDIGFYLRIRDIIDHGIVDPFTIKGMYYNSPMLNSLYQAAFSWLFGGGSAWGWKFSAVFSIMLTVPPIYMLGKRFAGRAAGLVAAVMLLSSHYVMAFTHTGYTHLDALPVTA